MTTDGALDVEVALDELLASGHSRTQATDLVVERALSESFGATTVVLAEGLSDQIAIEVVARGLGRDLKHDGIAVVPLGGATNVGRLLPRIGSGARLAGLYDVAQAQYFERALARSGLDVRGGLPSLGFFACDADLEDELIRAVGVAGVEQVLDAEGELASFRRMQREPFHCGGAVERQLHRFVSSHSGRKYRYARLLAAALDASRVPRPLAELLACI